MRRRCDRRARTASSSATGMSSRRARRPARHRIQAPSSVTSRSRTATCTSRRARDGRYLNPLRPGAMGPFEDGTRPTTRSVVASRRGMLVAETYDETPLAVPRPWFDLPVMPALVRWRLLDARGRVASAGDGGRLPTHDPTRVRVRRSVGTGNDPEPRARARPVQASSSRARSPTSAQAATWSSSQSRTAAATRRAPGSRSI